MVHLLYGKPPYQWGSLILSSRTGWSIARRIRIREDFVHHHIYKLVQTFSPEPMPTVEPDQLLMRSVQNVVITLDDGRHGVDVVATRKEINRYLQPGCLRCEIQIF